MKQSLDEKKNGISNIEDTILAMRRQRNESI